MERSGERGKEQGTSRSDFYGLCVCVHVHVLCACVMCGVCVRARVCVGSGRFHTNVHVLWWWQVY